MTPPDARVWLRAALDDLAQAREHLAFSSARSDVEGVRL